MTSNPKFKLKPVAAAVTSALLVGAGGSQALAQDEGPIEEIVTIGIRGSLQNSMNTKRNSTGVVDSIVAEDIGKFPDTNLAESLQRIAGVSIDRQNGEGSQITVRGFGPGFNLITLNGRTLPTAEVDISGNRDNYRGGQGRSFDFSNIASEGVSALEVYKTGQALLPSGGLGATVNIQTRRPLDTPGTQALFAVKGIADTSADSGDSITPEFTGLYSWTDDDEQFGVSVFGAYSKRDSASAIGQTNDWVVRRASDFFSDTSLVRAGSPQSNYVNPPADGELFAIPQDSRYDYSELSRERLNGQVVAQYRPSDALTLTADYYYVKNDSDEMRYEQTNWFATPFDQLVFDGEGPVSAATFMQEENNGTKDIGFEQTNRATRDVLISRGFNAKWELSDTRSVTLDLHNSDAESIPNNPLGHTATFVTYGAPVILRHQVDWTTGFPQQQFDIDDSIKGNGNGVMDTGDLATQVQRSSSQWQNSGVEEIDLRYALDYDNSSLTVGVNSRSTSVYVRGRTTQQDLGTWGMANPGDVELYAPGMVEQFCLSCKYEDYPVGQADVAFKSDATDLFPIFQDAYSANAVSIADNENWVDEDIKSVYAQFQLESEFAGLPVQINGGLRYEQTDVKATALQSVPQNILWTADNDFTIVYGSAKENVVGDGSYSHLLPNIDFRLDLTDDVVGRVSYSQTIGRVPYGNLFASTTAGAPNRPTVLGGQTGGSQQDPNLLPLESENFDISIEWYFGEDSYASIGFFDKKVKNFLGTGVFDKPLFGLLDPTAGAAGSRSGDALDIIDTLGIDRSEANLFTLVALIDANGGDRMAAQAEFESNLVNGALPQSYVDDILAAYDVQGDSADPLMQFRVTQPINDKDGHVYGWELAWQQFFSDTGFGVAANYTNVDGDVKADIGSDPNENQFALVGLSDTANFSVFYENFGWSARLSYNWRDKFLSQTNQGGSRSPQFTDSYGQLDMGVTYDVNDNFQVSFEGINLTGEDHREYRRKPDMLVWAYELSPRYTLGARYKF